MVPKQYEGVVLQNFGFRAVLFRMVPKPKLSYDDYVACFRAVLFRMVPKLYHSLKPRMPCFRAVLFRMVPKLLK